MQMRRAAIVFAGIMSLAFLTDVARAEPVFRSKLIYLEDPGRPFCYSPSIIELANGDLLCAWYAGSREGAPDVVLRYSRRSPGSDSWTPPAPLAADPGHTEGNPVLWQDPTGKVWCFYCTQTGAGWVTTQLKYITSTDNGATWSAPTNMVGDLGYHVRCHAFVASDGSWILPAYDERDWTSLMLISTDHGATWKMSGRISTGGGYKASTIQPSVIERADHTLRALCRMAPAPTSVYASVSTDFGRTWTAPKPTRLLNPGASVEQCRLANGHVVLVFNNSAIERRPMTVALSTDQGATWAVMRNLDTFPGEYSNPSVVQSRDGLIHLAYTYQRTHIKHVTFTEEWITTSQAPPPCKVTLPSPAAP